MKNPEATISIPNQQNPQYDPLVIVGRGIGKDAKGVWRPTSYFSRMAGGPRPVSGVFDNKVNPEEVDELGQPVIMIGGANANVLAAYHLYLQQDILGTPPKLVIFAAGRPPYLQNEPKDLSEGRVMAEKFLRKIALAGFSPPEILILSQNQNTQDDMNKSLAIARERGLNYLAFVTIAVQIERADAFLRKRLFEDQGREGFNYFFIPAEKILGGVDDRYKAAFKDIEKTTPYINNVFYEKRGLKALDDGEYLNSNNLSKL